MLEIDPEDGAQVLRRAPSDQFPDRYWPSRQASFFQKCGCAERDTGRFDSCGQRHGRSETGYRVATMGEDRAVGVAIWTTPCIPSRTQAFGM